MGSTSNPIFSGNSRFSQDFQSIISRATAIASLPITQLTSDKTHLSDQATALTGLDGKFDALEMALADLEEAIGGSSFEATVSDPTKLSVTLADGAVEGTYTVAVVSPGAYASSLTGSSWPSSGTHTYQLTMDAGVNKYNIVTSNTSAAGVAEAINAQYGDRVHAAVVNVGPAANPDYRISLQAVQLGTGMPDLLLDGGSGIQSEQTVGLKASYIVDNTGPAVESTSRSVTISPGITVNLLAATGDTPATFTVTQSTTALSDALSAFATAYNAAVDEVDKQHGTAGGVLSGQPVISQLSQALSRIATYSDPSSPLSGLASLGLSLDKLGHFSFNPFNLMATVFTSASAVTAFLGSAAGGGFLKSAGDGLAGISGSVTGLLPTTEAAVQLQITSLANQISTQQTRVDQMTTQMQEQMAAADALIASLEQQYNYLYGIFQAMQVNDSLYQ